MIYVDELRPYPAAQIAAPEHGFGPDWCHLTTDSDVSELHDFARRIGVGRNWFHDKSTVPHYDLTPECRARALLAGAVFKPMLQQARERAAQRRNIKIRSIHESAKNDV